MAAQVVPGCSHQVLAVHRVPLLSAGLHAPNRLRTSRYHTRRDHGRSLRGTESPPGTGGPPRRLRARACEALSLSNTPDPDTRAAASAADGVAPARTFGTTNSA